jgi:hypothetical protein
LFICSWELAEYSLNSNIDFKIFIQFFYEKAIHFYLFFGH